MPLKQLASLYTAQHSGGIFSNYFHPWIIKLKMKVPGGERPEWPNWTISPSLGYFGALIDNFQGKSEEREQKPTGQKQRMPIVPGVRQGSKERDKQWTLTS